MTKAAIIKNRADIATTLGPGTKLKGMLRFKDSVMVRGRFEGDIVSTGALYIDNGAQAIVGAMKASSIEIAGLVRGDLEAAQRVELRSTAQVHGNIKTVKLRIADGVVFEGRCEMVKNGERFDPFTNTGSGEKA
jgi:cytoskeletal protein CcmA (bactofilin family)